MIKNYSNLLFGGKISIPNIVIAGTKGKGSTCAVAESVIRTSGLRTCLFTSPHLVTPRERIKINGIPISEQEYVELFYDLQDRLEKTKLHVPPFFALHSLMAGLLFLHKKADVGIIECGIGGLFDWTKIFDPTVASVTHLEFDHQESLGNTPYSIASQKFGIYTKKSINLTVPHHGAFQVAFDELTKQSGLNIKIIKPIWIHESGINGPCSQENTALGVASAKELLEIMNIKSYDVLKGAKNATIHGRFQIIDVHGIRWMLDGAHTEESIKYCLDWYKSFKNNSKNDILLCATTKNRNPNKLFKHFIQMKWKNIIYVKEYNNITMNGIKSVPTLKEAINMVIKSKPKSIVVTGSLHLVGDSLKNLGFGPQ